MCFFQGLTLLTDWKVILFFLTFPDPLGCSRTDIELSLSSFSSFRISGRSSSMAILFSDSILSENIKCVQMVEWQASPVQSSNQDKSKRQLLQAHFFLRGIKQFRRIVKEVSMSKFLIPNLGLLYKKSSKFKYLWNFGLVHVKCKSTDLTYCWQILDSQLSCPWLSRWDRNMLQSPQKPGHQAPGQRLGHTAGRAKSVDWYLESVSLVFGSYSWEIRTLVKPLRADISINNAFYHANLGAKLNVKALVLTFSRP